MNSRAELELYLSGQYLIGGENQFLGGKTNINQHLFKSSVVHFILSSSINNCTYLIGMLIKKEVSLMLVLICTVFCCQSEPAFENKKLNTEINSATYKIVYFGNLEKNYTSYKSVSQNE